MPQMLHILRERGYAIRQHLPEEVWTRRKRTVVDLDDHQRALLEAKGPEALTASLKAEGSWTFPAFDIDAPLPRATGIDLARGGRVAACVVVPQEDPELLGIAAELVSEVSRHCGVELPVKSDQRVNPEAFGEQPLILVGGSDRNRLSLALALRYQTGFVDAAIPGDDGWVVTTHLGLAVSGAGVAQISAGPKGQHAAIDRFMASIVQQGESVRLRPVHDIHPGPRLRAHLKTWEDFVNQLLARVSTVLPKPSPTAPEDPSDLADLLAFGLKVGGPEAVRRNEAPIDMLVTLARYYQLSGDQRSVQLFRELLLRLADYYLKTPGGTCYPTALEFRLGNVISRFSCLEHHPVFTDADRLLLANLLLACSRTAYDYTVRVWPLHPEEATPHNHQTFPARTLTCAADYFSRFGVPDVDAWRQLAEQTFSGDLWKRKKLRENANHYEALVYEHAVSFRGLVGAGLTPEERDTMQAVVERQIVSTDNFLRSVDFGDTGVRMSPRDRLELAGALAAETADAGVRWFVSQGFDRQPDYLGSPLDVLPGLQRPVEGRPPPSGSWELAPLEPEFLREHDPSFPRELAFDKLALRTGWGDSDHFIFLDGVGNKAISHSHCEANAVVRLNHRGRHWVVSNGYGNRPAVTDASDLFSTRERGPVDHNVLVLHREGAMVRDMPPFAGLLDLGQRGRLLWSSSALWDYGGTDWVRTLVVLAGTFVLVVDRVRVIEPGLDSAHIEWNCLGEAEPTEAGCRLAQNGVHMHVASSPAPPSLEVADQSESWRQVLDSGAYPHASFPLRKLVFQVPRLEPGDISCLATLWVSSEGDDAPCTLSRVSDRQFRVDGPCGGEEVEVTGDLTLSLAEGILQVGLGSFPMRPETKPSS